jgi:general secretion pathway protein I
MRIKRKLSAAHGFTLLEVLVAFAVLALVAGAIFGIYETSPTRILKASNQRAALLVARSVLDSVGTVRPVQAGAWQAKQDGVNWNLLVEPYAPEIYATPDSAAPLVPYRVHVKATAGARWSAGEATLTTLRLGPRTTP